MWIPVTERLPSGPHHCPIIHQHTTLDGQTVVKQWYAAYEPDDGLWHDLRDWYDVSWSQVVTHWFELPALAQPGQWSYSGAATIQVYGGGLLAMRLEGPFPQGAPEGGHHGIRLALCLQKEQQP